MRATGSLLMSSISIRQETTDAVISPSLTFLTDCGSERWKSEYSGKRHFPEPTTETK